LVVSLLDSAAHELQLIDGNASKEVRTLAEYNAQLANLLCLAIGHFESTCTIDQITNAYQPTAIDCKLLVVGGSIGRCSIHLHAIHILGIELEDTAHIIALSNQQFAFLSTNQPTNQSIVQSMRACVVTCRSNLADKPALEHDVDLIDRNSLFESERHPLRQALRSTDTRRVNPTRAQFQPQPSIANASITLSEFQHVSSQPSSMNCLPYSLAARFNTELTLSRERESAHNGD
jgi:hypothetical protein